MIGLSEALVQSPSEARTFKVYHREFKEFVLKQFRDGVWVTPQPGDIVKAFIREFEVISNEPGNVVVKEILK